MILTADWHLTDQPQDEYRWLVFAQLNELLQQTGPTEVQILGDLTDRKDKHSGELTNRLVAELVDGLHPNAHSINIIMGNHDKPLRGTPFWHFLNRSARRGLRFCTEPTHTDTGYILLPFHDNPEQRWADLDLSQYRAAFIHQPVDGVLGENGYAVKGSPMPLWPRRIKVYAGDIHKPQKVGKVQYVGAPHHVKFGDDYPCRMLIVDDKTFEIEREVILSPPAKALVEITSVEQLEAYDFGPGDQVKIRFSLPSSDLENFAADERKIAAWAEARGIRVGSLETLVIEPARQSADEGDSSDDPREVLAAFAEAEGLDEARLEVGMALLQETIGE